MRTYALALGGLMIGGLGCSDVLGLSDFVDAAEAGADGAGATGAGGDAAGGSVAIGGGGGGGGGAGNGGPTGGGGAGATGGAPATCGDGELTPGELCVGGAHTPSPSGNTDLRGFVLQDCDEDGDVDILAVHYGAAGLTALPNDGSGAFPGFVQNNAFSQLIDIDIANLGAGAYEVAAVSSVSGRTVYFTPTGGCNFSSVNSEAAIGTARAVTYVRADANASLDAAKILLDSGGGSADVVINFNHTLGTTESVYGGGTLPAEIEAGDFTGDLAMDLLVVVPANDTLHLITNEGGTFVGGGGDPMFGLTGDGPIDLDVGDLDGDGDDDVVIANEGDGTISVLRGVGAGSFVKQNPSPTVVGDNGVPASAPRAVTLADVDLDGDLDAVTANAGVADGMSSLSIFLNDGAGKLELAPPIPTGPAPDSVRVGDLNGDGAPDIVAGTGAVTAGSSTLYIHFAEP